eukprot:1057368-Ditylum_brightwellii.AAC.1
MACFGQKRSSRQQQQQQQHQQHPPILKSQGVVHWVFDHPPSDLDGQMASVLNSEPFHSGTTQRRQSLSGIMGEVLSWRVLKRPKRFLTYHVGFASHYDNDV